MISDKKERMAIVIAVICLFSAWAYAEIIFQKEGSGTNQNSQQRGNVEVYKAGRRFHPGQKEDYGTTEASNVEAPVNAEAAADINKYLNAEQIKKIGEVVIPIIKEGKYKDFYANYLEGTMNMDTFNLDMGENQQ